MAAWRAADAGEGRLVLVAGEPGIGKTRLVQELRALAEIAGGRALTGECYAEGGTPYGPIAQMLRLVLVEGPPPAAPLAPAILDDLLTLAPDLRAYLAPAGAGAPDPRARTLEPQVEQSRVFESFVALCTALAAETPLVLCVEDGHWADSGTLFLLRHVARRIRRQRILIVLTYRETDLDQACCLPEVLADLNRERLSARLKLGRFGPDGTQALLAALFQGPVAAELAAAVHHETEGNPFFIEEVCKTLIEEGRLKLVDGHWRADGLSEIIIPQSVRVTIQARVAKLPEPAQEALRLAAVLGREFDFETLSRASDLGEDALIAALEAAERAQLIMEARRAGRAAFIFAHALIPSALREGVGRLRRQRLHRRAALAIEALRPDDFEALAYHTEQAGDEGRARAYYLQAGERALAVYANPEAERHLRLVLETLTEAGPEAGADRRRALTGLGEALFRQGRYEAALLAWREAEQLYRQSGQPDQAGSAARLWARMARAAWQANDLAGSLALCREGLSLYGAGPENAGLAYLIQETGRACCFNHQYEEAGRLCQRALEIGRRLGLVEVQAETLATLGILPGEPPEAHLSYLTESVALAEAANLPATAIRGRNNLSNAVRELGRPAREAYDHLRRAREHARRIGSAAEELKYLLSEGFGLGQMGDLAGFAALRREARELAAQLPSTEVTAAHLGLLEVFALFLTGDLEAALAAAEAGEARARAQDLRELVDEYATLRARSHHFLGNLAAAEAALRDALAAVDRGEQSVGSYAGLAMALAEQGRTAEARAALDRAWAERGPFANEIFELLLATAEAALASAAGQAGASWEKVEAGLANLERQGWRWTCGVLMLEAALVELRGAQPDRQRVVRRLRQAQAISLTLGLPGYAALAARHLQALEAT